MQVEEDAKASAKGGQKDEKAKPKARKKTVDKWKKKIWYTLYAPAYFESKPLGETVAEKPEMVQNRVIIVGARDLSATKRSSAAVHFKVKEVKGNKAYTEAVGHEISADFLRRMVRRRSSKIECVQDLTTKDGVKVRVKTFVLTGRKATNNQRAAVRRVAEADMASFVKAHPYDKVITEFVFGTLPNKIGTDTKKLAIIKKVEIVKSMVLPQ